MKNNYTYPAIFDYSEEGYINIEFPMFDGAFTAVESGDDPIIAAQDVLVLAIKDYEDSKKELPSEADSLVAGDKQRIFYINIWMPYHKQSIKETYVKKTLTIPVWLDILAKQANINFSSILVKGLKEELNID